MKRKIASAMILSVLLVSSCGGSETVETEQSTKAVSMENLDYALTSATEEEGETTTATDKDGNVITLLVESGTKQEEVTGSGGSGGGWGTDNDLIDPDTGKDKYVDFEIEPVKNLTFGEYKVAYYTFTEKLSAESTYTFDDFKKEFEDELNGEWDNAKLTEEQRKAMTATNAFNSYIRSGITEERKFGEGSYVLYCLGGFLGGYISQYEEETTPLVINFEQSEKCNWRWNFSAFEQNVVMSDGSEINDSLLLTKSQKEKEDQSDEAHFYFELMQNGKILRNPKKIPTQPRDIDDTDVKAIATTLGDFEVEKLTNKGDALYLPKTEITYYVNVKGEDERKELKVGMAFKTLQDQIGKGIKVDTTETNTITGEVVDKTYYIYKTDEFTLIVEPYEYKDAEYETPLMEGYPDDKMIVKTIVLLDNEFEYRPEPEEEETTETDVPPAEADTTTAEDSSAETTMAA